MSKKLTPELVYGVANTRTERITIVELINKIIDHLNSAHDNKPLIVPVAVDATAFFSFSVQNEEVGDRSIARIDVVYDTTDRLTTVDIQFVHMLSSRLSTEGWTTSMTPPKHVGGQFQSRMTMTALAEVKKSKGVHVTAEEKNHMASLALGSSGEEEEGNAAAEAITRLGSAKTITVPRTPGSMDRGQGLKRQ